MARGSRIPFLLVAWLAGFAALALFYVLGPPPPKGGVIGVGFDKMLHGLVFTGGTVLGLLWAHRSTVRQRAVLAVCLSLGVLLEVLQGLMPAREFSVRDISANVASVLAAWVLWKLVTTRPKGRKRDEGRVGP